MSALAAIHIKRKQLGMEEDDFRDVVERTTGQRSTKGLKPQQSAALLGELDRMTGGKTSAVKKPSKGSRTSLEGPYAKKIQALWISAWNLGLVGKRDDDALASFVKRQTGIDHPNWMKDPVDAASVIEALKKWMERERSVDWALNEGDPSFPDHMRLPGYKVTFAQWQVIKELNAYRQQSFLGFVADYSGKQVEQMVALDWIPIMNELGVVVRREIKKGGRDA